MPGSGAPRRHRTPDLLRRAATRRAEGGYAARSGETTLLGFIVVIHPQHRVSCDHTNEWLAEWHNFVEFLGHSQACDAPEFAIRSEADAPFAPRRAAPPFRVSHRTPGQGHRANC